MPLPRGKVALNVVISSDARKLLRILAIQSGRTTADLVEEMIKIRCNTLEN
jgi:hypothetical protein